MYSLHSPAIEMANGFFSSAISVNQFGRWEMMKKPLSSKISELEIGNKLPPHGLPHNNSSTSCIPVSLWTMNGRPPLEVTASFTI